MNIIEVQALPNGAHRNQNNFEGALPEGWAVIPEDVEIPDSFPCVGVEAEERTYFKEVLTDGKNEQEEYTMLTVTALTPGVLPGPVVEERLPTDEERIAALEEALAQTDEAAIELYEAQAEQEAINAAQDEALIEIYEMMEV